MSEALSDEIEAINSIYGDGTLTQSDTPDEYILTLPSQDSEGKKRSSLRVQFPGPYPDVPPLVLSTLGYLPGSGTAGKKGDAAREADLFMAALGDVFSPGAVCLFDALERVADLLKGGHHDEKRGDAGPESEDDNGHDQTTTQPSEDQREPPWTLSDPQTEQKSTFVARCAPVSSPSQAQAYLSHLLATDKRVRTATHNITAWRIRGPTDGVLYQDCDDDGETAAGSRLLHLMQVMDVWDVMVVVTRWYGGLKLGPRRFALINSVARGAFVNAGLVSESQKKRGR